MPETLVYGGSKAMVRSTACLSCMPTRGLLKIHLRPLTSTFCALAATKELHWRPHCPRPSGLSATTRQCPFSLAEEAVHRIRLAVALTMPSLEVVVHRMLLSVQLPSSVAVAKGTPDRHRWSIYFVLLAAVLKWTTSRLHWP